MFQNECKSNVHIANDLGVHNHEGAETLILYGIYVTRTDTFQMLVVCSPDTDVLLLLIFSNKILCRKTIFRKGNANFIRNVDVDIIYEALGKEKSAAILSFRSFTGDDQTATFYGKSKLFSWKTFVNSRSCIFKSLSELNSNTEDVSDSTRKGTSYFILYLDCRSHRRHSWTFLGYDDICI